jgi:hypothetical protein
MLLTGIGEDIDELKSLKFQGFRVQEFQSFNAESRRVLTQRTTERCESEN